MPDAYVCTSSEVVNVIREYERFSTVAMNAYIGPQTSAYICERLEGRLRDGGIAAPRCGSCSRTAASPPWNSIARPVGLLLSGPRAA